MRSAKIFAGAVLGATMLSGAASAAIQATATTDLSLRAGPGTQYGVIGVIPASGVVAIQGCTESRLWCSVTHDGVQGWASGSYLASMSGGEQIVIRESRVEVPIVSLSSGTAAGTATGAVAGAIVGGPVGAVVGGIAGAVVGSEIDPPEHVDTYVTRTRVEPVYLEGSIAVGTALPSNVAIHPVPDYTYSYAYVNDTRVLVAPETRRIVYVYD